MHDLIRRSIHTKRGWMVALTLCLCFMFPAFAQQKPDSIIVTINKLGAPINSAFADYAPVISADGLLMMFTSRKPITKKGIKKNKEGKENIYKSTYDPKTEKWSEPKLLEAPINQAKRYNSAIALSNDGLSMLLYRDDANGDGDIYQSYLKGDKWTELERLPEPINSNDIESSASISPDGRTIYFCSNRKGSIGGSDIWYCTKDQNDMWGKAENMGLRINTKENEEGVFIHPDGKTLYFSSKGHNGIGGYDIFKSVFENGKWLPPVNLGAPVNTINDDVYFVITANNKVGYYASANSGGIGEKDIYKIDFTVYIPPKLSLFTGHLTDEDNNAIRAEIYIINAKTQEIVSVLESDSITGKFSVSLPTGQDYKLKVISDDYLVNTQEFNIPEGGKLKEIKLDVKLKPKEPLVAVDGYVLDENGNPLMATVEIVNIKTGEVIGKATTDKSGKFITKLKGGKNYAFVVPAKGYLYQSMNLEVSLEKDHLTLNKTVLKKIEKGKNVVLNNIFFDFDKATLRPDSKSELVRLMNVLRNNPGMKIEISGHTDSKGSVAYNFKLSEERAKSIEDYLIKNGVNPLRLTFKGYGFDQPIASNDTEEGRQINRRTEIKVLEIDFNTK